MLTKIAFALALTLGAASAASAATKHPIHHHRAPVASQQAPANSSYGYVAAPSRSGNPNETGTNFLSSGCGIDGC
jgi:hypothetical protein